jgi:hypothetical protein
MKNLQLAFFCAEISTNKNMIYNIDRGTNNRRVIRRINK